MQNLGLIFLFLLFVNVVSGVETEVVEAVSVIFGDSVTLQSEVTQIQSYDVIEWRFSGHRIAIINSDPNKRVQAEVTEKLRDRMQLDHQTGDLKIRNIRTADCGLYELDINSARGSAKKSFNISGVASDDTKVVLVMERDSVILPSGLSKIQREDRITWKFKDTLIAELNETAGIFSTYDDVLDGRFRYRLHLNNQTGSLIVTDVKPNISGLYEINISKSSSRYTTHKTFNVTSKEGESRQSVMEGNSVTLLSGVPEIHSDDVIVWRSEHGDSIIAKIDRGKVFTTLDGADGRYSGTLELDSKTGSLTIRHIRTEHAGLYHLDITGQRRTIFKRFFVSVGSQNWFRYVMVVIVVAVLLLVVIGAIAVIRCRQTRNGKYYKKLMY
ncbi:uncharacterized protein LOC132160273 [Carassius carassius]|uniref:uncharacterized protein LOC132160273 n=1 Tax=Carassius carassius TaxID=217509 RepID=UPI002868874E|nr:uncharacterized protein LOC132160273 [Carassius carassius]